MKTRLKYSLTALCALSLVVLPAAIAGHGEKEFKAMDTNNDGFVSRAEHAAGAKVMFDKIDADHNGTVTLAEAEACKEMDGPDMPKMTAAEKIAMCDANNDGKLTAAEHATSAEAMFAKADTNNDGKIGLDECEAAHKAMMKDHAKK